MKIAFFSPFPPKQTGIASYSQALVAALRGNNRVTAFDHGNPALLEGDEAAVDFGANPETLGSLNNFDAVIYSLGNNPHYHIEILRVFLRRRGILLLHDAVLYFLFAGLPQGSFYKQFCLNFGVDRFPEISQIRNDSKDGDLLRYRHPERFPFLQATIRQAEAVIVHSQFAAASVRALAPETPVFVIPLLALTHEDRTGHRAQRAAELRHTVLTREGQVLLGTFGFLGSTKRLTSICNALVRLRDSIDFHFVIVGEGPDPLEEFTKSGLGDRVTWLRYVPDGDFDPWIEAADIVLNLRFPSMGETSATLTRAMGIGKPCIVTDFASFAELPDETVWKIPHGPDEIDSLVNAISQLASDDTLRTTIRAAARQFVATEQAPDRVASSLVGLISNLIRNRAQDGISNTTTSEDSSALVLRRLKENISSILPSHLQMDTMPSTQHNMLPCSLELTPGEVIAAYQVLLERSPDPNTEIPANIRNFGTLRDLRSAILASEEYRILSSTP